MTDSPAPRPARRRVVEPDCPIRDGDVCNLCQPGVTGPQNCGLVYLVMDDPELRQEYSRRRAQVRAQRAALTEIRPSAAPE